MSAATIVFARDDLSIPGSKEMTRREAGRVADAESNFFNLLRNSNPDVIVLDLSRNPASGVTTILKI